MKRIRPLLAMALALALICLGGSFAFADDEGNGRSVTDLSTMSDWQAVVGSDTSNIGRIWTDKTVSADKITTSSGDVVGRGDSSFITALSVLSSTSNAKSTSTTPLDIVLVLDASGSMDDPMGNSDRTKRIDALKNAANDFVSKIAAQNKGISDASKQHQVSIVKFAGNKSAAVGNDTYRGEYGYTYNYSQVMKTMSPCTDADAFKDTINSISPAGSTRADYGLQLADDQNSNREDAKKIVVFFTDGSPTSSSGFEDGVASSAVASAKAMKDKDKGKGATVYTIGIFNGANPSADPTASGSSNENKFMHAVSSNYPNASYTESSGFWGGWNWDLGTRPEGSDYYKSATNAAELEKVFDDISSEIVKGSGYPTSTTEGAEHQSGYITFDDPLGAYMKVDAFEAIAVAGKTFYNPTKSTEGKVDTYTFAGKVELNGKNVDVGDVKITVTNSGDDDLATGDMVKVEVPAALIPLRSFNVDQDKMTTTVSDTQPINVVYTSSLKPEAENLLANPDDAMTQYLQANSKDGKASFYSNDWEQGYLGKTVASFEPSKDNSYYYFTSDTPIYTDEACTQRAHQVVKGNTYWYKHSYFEMASGGAAEAKEKPVSFKGDDAEVVEGAIGNNDEGAYFKSGTTRLTYLNELYKEKTSNDTGTALDVLNPKWVVAGQVGSYLGNNGKLSVDLPGTLAVTKQLQVPEGYTLSDFENDSFDFTIDIAKAANKGFSAVVKNASGEQQGNAFTLPFNNEGKATHSLKAGETLYVYGLDGGWNYEVSEADHAGFTQDGTGLKGVIVAGQTANAKVVNSYSPEPATAAIGGTKTLTGRGMTANETFGFELSAADDATQSAVRAGAVTLPDAATVSGAKVDEVKGFQFGNITFKKPGEYTFNVNETQWNGAAVPATDEKGMQFDRNTQTVKVKVTDDHTGSLKAEVTYPNGAAAVAFTNKYATSSTYNGIQVSKTLQGRNMAADEFHFTIAGNDELLTDADKHFTNENNRADGLPDVMTKLSGHTFTQADNGKHYEFTVKETIPEGAVWDQATGLWYVGATGLYYDGANHVVTIDVADDGNGQLKVTTKVDGQDGNVVSFVNKYRAQGVSFDTANAQLKKILEGRDWLDSDSFTFNLKALTDGAPMPDGAVDGVATATVTKANAENFGFGSITYTSDMLQGAPSKTFKYEVSEATGTIEGIDYTTNKATITVTVVDNGEGKLTASASTENGTFVNRYTASVDYTANGGIQLAKLLKGRDMAEGQFKVAVTPKDAESANVLGLAEGSNEFAMPAGTDDNWAKKRILSDNVVFTQSDVGKTYTYTVAEVNEGAAGYTYDGTVYTVTIAVTISDTGKLTVTTTVTGGESAGTYVYTSDSSAQHNPVTLAFTNSYKAEGDVAISGTKTLSGRDLAAGEFSFAVKYAAGGDDLLSAKNDANGSIDFGTLSYSTESLAQLVKDGKAKKGQDGKWTVDYVACEKTDRLEKSGITPQTESIHFTVTVVDNGNGTLAATANTGNNGLLFKNAYSTGDPIEVGLSGVKTLKAGEGLTPASIEGKFTFTVTSDDAAAPMPQKTTATNDANGNVDFGSIAFSLDDLNKALGTTNTRATDTDNSAVSKGEDQSAQGAAAQNGAAGSDAADQADTEQGSAVDSGNGAEGQGAVMAADDGQGAASAKTVANDADAADDGSDQAQGSEPSTRAGVSRSHIFTYKVTESGSADGVTNDPDATKTVSFKVTDDGNGKLTVKRQDATSDLAFAFTNTYSVQPTDSSVTDQVTVTKQLTGRDMTAGEFAFELLEGGKVVAKGTNGADGSVALSSITYTEPGTHSYTLREADGGTHKAGVEYDGSVFAVTTTVTDNGNGTLSVAHKVDNDANAVGFANTYAPAATSVTLGASKVLNGKSLEDGEFSFALEGEDGTQLVAKNDANGMVAFPAIQYSKAGTYQYTLSEVKGTESGVTYDETTYAVAVAVEDDGKGSLVATVSYEGGKAPVFNNTYQEPEGPAAADDPVSFVKAAVSGVAKTGDSLLGIAGAIAAVAAAAAAVAVLSLRKKGKHAKK